MKSYTETRAHLDERIVQYIEGRRLNINGINENILEKKQFLQVLGYGRLRVSKDEFLPLGQCENTRISAVVKGLYSSAKRRLRDLVLSS